VRLDRRISTDEIERSLRATARAALGDERAEQVDRRLASMAEMLALVAAEPVEFAGDPPDLSGIDEDNGSV
jgi:hypothetical protein